MTSGSRFKVMQRNDSTYSGLWACFCVTGLSKSRTTQLLSSRKRLTLEAAVTGNRERAVEALTVHPLVPSYRVSKQLVDEYLKELSPGFRSLPSCTHGFNPTREMGPCVLLPGLLCRIPDKWRMRLICGGHADPIPIPEVGP